MFDLPTATKEERAAATKFRNYLLNEEFERSQYSVYARFVGSRESIRSRINRIKQNTPRSGDVQIICLTDRQYGDIVRIVDKRTLGKVDKPGNLVEY